MVNRHHIALGTISFTVCFAAWGLIGAFAPRFREAFHLTPSETALLVEIPVLLGSLARIPMGILTDRFDLDSHAPFSRRLLTGSGPRLHGDRHQDLRRVPLL